MVALPNFQEEFSGLGYTIGVDSSTKNYKMFDVQLVSDYSKFSGFFISTIYQANFSACQGKYSTEKLNRLISTVVCAKLDDPSVCHVSFKSL